MKQSGYLELAATGIAAQDETEKQILLKNKPTQVVALGSVKANIGNTYAASGIAGLIKTALCVYHRFIPGIPNWEAPKDVSAFENSNYYFPSKSRPWILQNGQNKRYAAVNGLDDIQKINLLPKLRGTILHSLITMEFCVRLFTPFLRSSGKILVSAEKFATWPKA